MALSKREINSLLKDFNNLYNQDKKSIRISKSIVKDLDKLVKKDSDYKKTQASKMRKKVSTNKKKKVDLLKSRQSKKTIKLKDDDAYTAHQKSFFLPKPKKVTASFLSSSAFFFFLMDNFYSPLYDFFSNKKFYSKKWVTLATIGYHFYFDKKGDINNQSGFRSPKIDIDKNNIDDVIRDLFSQTFERFDAYFKTRNKSGLYFEGITGEISFSVL